MLLRVAFHVALMLFFSGRSYYAQVAAVEVPPSTNNKATTNRVANNENNGKQQSDGDYLILDVLNLEKGMEGSKETLDSSEEANALDLLNCSQPANLDRYCTDINAEEHAFFEFDLSVIGLLASLFRVDIVKNLTAKCQLGSWCLPDTYHQQLLQGESVFYGVNPLCSDIVWTCLETMVDERQDCEEKDLQYLANSVYLMCDLENEGTLEPECYARTLEALYATYVADLLHVADSQRTESGQTDCNGYRAQMTKTYIRALDACSSYQISLLNKFKSWKDIVKNIDATSFTCDISYNKVHASSSASYGDEAGEDEAEEAVEKEELGEILQDIANEMGEAAETESGIYDNDADGMNANANDANQNDNKVMVVGAVVVTTVMVAGLLGLALLSYRRCRARCGYDKWGYSKLGEEESTLLRGEFT